MASHNVSLGQVVFAALYRFSTKGEGADAYNVHSPFSSLAGIYVVGVLTYISMLQDCHLADPAL